jgi:hypothetical protein
MVRLLPQGDIKKRSRRILQEWAQIWRSGALAGDTHCQFAAKKRRMGGAICPLEMAVRRWHRRRAVRGGDDAMDAGRVPVALGERLGHAATAGLIELLDDTRKQWAVEVVGMVGDRFERRLIEETSAIRLAMAEDRSAWRQEFAALRHEMATRQDSASLGQEIAGLRQEVAGLRADFSKEMAGQRADLLKWMFVFWVGQFFAVASLLVVLVRVLRPVG